MTFWGYDPVVPQRYAQFIAYSQGDGGEYNGVSSVLHHVRPLLRLVRLRFVFLPQGDRLKWVETPGGLPHLLLVSGWQQIRDRDRILAALSAPSFDASKTVILESDPEPPPVSGAESGAARLLSTTTDSLTIAADVTRPALLLVTDSYSRYWRAVALRGSSQSEYQVMPADYTLIAVPLGPGHHLFRLEYAPSGWVIGKWVSLASLLVYIAFVVCTLPALATRRADRSEGPKRVSRNGSATKRSRLFSPQLSAIQRQFP